MSHIIDAMESGAQDLPKAERRNSAPVKRRVSRACDHCHRMRTRCNGQSPCSRCIELEYVCQYHREKKRRGKVSANFVRVDSLDSRSDPCYHPCRSLDVLLVTNARWAL